MPNQCQCNAGYQNMNNDPSKGYKWDKVGDSRTSYKISYPIGVLPCVTAVKMDTAWRREFAISAVRVSQLGIRRAILAKTNLK